MIMLDLSKNWKRVIDSLHSGVMVIDTGGAIRHVNPFLEDLTGYRADELVGNTCVMLCCSGCEPWYGQGGSWCMLFGSEESMKPMACTINSKSGHRLNVVKQASVFRDSNGLAVGAVETFWDMARLKERGPHNGCPETLTEIFKMVPTGHPPF
jgi:two-component system, NtrC family, response regulator HydG